MIIHSVIQSLRLSGLINEHCISSRCPLKLTESCFKAGLNSPWLVLSHTFRRELEKLFKSFWQQLIQNWSSPSVEERTFPLHFDVMCCVGLSTWRFALQIPWFHPNPATSPWGVRVVFSEVWSKTWLDVTLSTSATFETLWTLSAWPPSSSSTLLRCRRPSPLVDFLVSVRNAETDWSNNFQES